LTITHTLQKLFDLTTTRLECANVERFIKVLIDQSVAAPSNSLTNYAYRHFEESFLTKALSPCRNHQQSFPGLPTDNLVKLASTTYSKITV